MYSKKLIGLYMDEIRAVVLHWGLNMWGESLPGGVKAVTGGQRCNDRVRLCDVEKGRSAT